MKIKIPHTDIEIPVSKWTRRHAVIMWVFGVVAVVLAAVSLFTRITIPYAPSFSMAIFVFLQAIKQFNLYADSQESRDFWIGTGDVLAVCLFLAVVISQIQVALMK